MRFFFDNNLPPNLARALHELSGDDHEVTHLRSKFKPDIKDVDWLRALAEERGWVIVSGDLRISKNRVERKIWLSTGLSVFFLERAWSDRPFWTKAEKLVHHWPGIISAATRAAGKSYSVPVKGRKLKHVS